MNSKTAERENDIDLSPPEGPSPPESSPSSSSGWNSAVILKPACSKLELNADKPPSSTEAAVPK